MTNPITSQDANPLPNGFTLIRPGTLMEHLVTGEQRARPDLRLRDLIDQIGVEPRDGAPSYSLYGGATITQVWDAAGTRYTICDARDPSGWFGLHCFGDKGQGNYNIPLQQRVTGRGSANGNAYSGLGEWVGWEGSYFFNDVIPGFAAFSAGGGMSGGVYIPQLPPLYSAAYDGQTFSSPHWIDMPAVFHAPPARAYYMRMVVLASKADIRGRLGSEGDPGAASVNTQQANVQEHQGWLVSATDNRLYFSVVDGNGQVASAKVWLKVIGFMTP